MNFCINLILAIIYIVCHVNGANILVVAPFFASSHTKVVRAVTLNLAKRGHDLTVITSNLIEDPPPRYKQIPVDFSELEKSQKTKWSYWDLRHQSSIERVLFTWREVFIVNEYAFKSQSLQDFIKNDESHFDVIIIEMFFEEVMYMFTHKYKAPLILLETSTVRRCAEDFMGNPLPVSYVPHDYLLTGGDLSFRDRINNLLVGTFEYFGRKYYYLPKCYETAQEQFSNLPKPLPKIEEIERNVSLILANTHYSIDTVMPLIPGIVQIGGIHVEPPKALPHKIQKFLDEAHDGVIVFSMGSHIQISTMDLRRLEALFKIFASLKQRVIMKWEKDTPPAVDNIMALKHIPQNDVLAHPNVKAFMTHGGMLGIQEAITYGVPIVGMPLFADQYANIGRLVHLGAAVELDLLDINEDTVNRTMNEILNVPKYRQMALVLSKRFKERPMGPVDTAMYWIEYVIKFNGTTFLKSPLVHMPWYRYRMLDVAASLVALVTLCFVTSCYVKRKLIDKFNRCRQAKIKKRKQH